MSFTFTWSERPKELIQRLSRTRFELDVASQSLPHLVPGSREHAATKAHVHELARNLALFDTSTFHLDIITMKWCYEFMDLTGMIYASEPPSREPLFSKYGLDIDEYEALALCEPGTEPDASNLAPNQVAYLDALRAHRSGREPVQAGIASHKFGSHARWRVTPDECRGALANYAAWRAEQGYDADYLPATTDDQGHTRLIEWWPEWLDFLEKSIDHDGFVVR